MKILNLFSDTGYKINISGEDIEALFPIREISIFLPTFALIKTKDSINGAEGWFLNISFPTDFYAGGDIDCFRISLKVLGFGFQYYYQWSY